MRARGMRRNPGGNRRFGALRVACAFASTALRRCWLVMGHVSVLLMAALLQALVPAHANEADGAATVTGPAASSGRTSSRIPEVSTTRPSARQRAADRLRRIDADGDGFISRAEAARRAPKLAERFALIDGDLDGRLSPQEIRAGARVRRTAAGSVQAAALRDARLGAADRDGDGRISREEAEVSLPRIAGKFARIDADGDGFVDAGEFRAWIERRKSARMAAKPPRQG